MESTQSTLNIDKYWHIIKQRWLLGAIVFLSLFGLGCFATLIQEPVYEAQAKLRFRKSNISSSLTEVSREIGTLSPLAQQGNPIDTEAEVIRSVPLIQKTINELKLKNDKGELITVNSFLNKLQVNAISTTDVLRVTYQNPDPKKAAQVVNTLVANYLDNNILVNRAEAIAAREFLEEQLPHAEQTLLDTEAAIKQIQEENQVISIQEYASAIVANLRDLQTKTTEIQGDISNVNSQSDYLRQKLGFTSQQALVASAIGQSPEIQNTMAQLQQLESELALENTRYQPNSPNIVQLKEKISSLKQLLEQQTQTVAGSKARELYGNGKFSAIQQRLTDELIQLEARNIGLNKQLDYLLQVEQQQREKASQIPQLEQRLRQLDRKLGASQTTYQLLLQQLQTIELAENQNIGNVRVISYAIAPDNPVSSRAVSLLASAMLAALAAAGAIYLSEITDKSLKTIEEIKQLFGYTWLGVIPDLERLNLEHLPESTGDSAVPKLIVRDYPSLAVSESYRMLQSNLKFLNSDRQVKTIVVTSSVAQEGKSTVSANLASAMAQVGNKVLLIDADLHNPIQHHIWNIYNDNGLSNVIAEQLDPRMAIQEVMSNLDLLTSGVIPPSPATLLDSQRMRILMDYWSESYDFVIIDTPSLDMVADAPIMGRMADGVLLVVKPGAVERAKANFTKEILEQSGQNILGIVFNSVSPNSEPHTYYYHALEDQQETAKLLNSSRPQEELWETISRLARESKKNKLSIDLNTQELQVAPLKQLEAMIVYLQDDLADLTKLVTEQEDELLMQRQKVKKLEKKYNLATEQHRKSLENHLKQEQERKRMLDETLVGQRLNLERRKEELYQYQQILEMRQNQSQI